MRIIAMHSNTNRSIFLRYSCSYNELGTPLLPPELPPPPSPHAHAQPQILRLRKETMPWVKILRQFVQMHTRLMEELLGATCTHYLWGTYNCFQPGS